MGVILSINEGTIKHFSFVCGAWKDAQEPDISRLYMGRGENQCVASAEYFPFRWVERSRNPERNRIYFMQSRMVISSL
jgi:hypothetical protein